MFEAGGSKYDQPKIKRGRMRAPKMKITRRHL